MKNFIYLFIIILFSQCQKDTSTLQTRNYINGVTVENNTIYFESDESFITSLKEISALNEQERLDWSQSKGIESLNQVYLNLWQSFENVKSKKEYVDLAKKNSKFIELIDTENELNVIPLCIGILTNIANENFTFYLKDKEYNVIEIYRNSQTISNDNSRTAMINCGTSQSDMVTKDDPGCDNDRRGYLDVKLTVLPSSFFYWTAACRRSTMIGKDVVVEQLERGQRRLPAIPTACAWIWYSNSKNLDASSGAGISNINSFIVDPFTLPAASCADCSNLSSEVITVVCHKFGQGPFDPYFNAGYFRGDHLGLGNTLWNEIDCN